MLSPWYKSLCSTFTHPGDWGTAGLVWNVSDPSSPDISAKAKARVRHLIQVNPGSLFLPLLPYNRAQNPKWLEHWGTTR